MQADRWERIKDVVDAAVDLSGEDRARFLDEQCDASLRAEVDKLIANYDSAGDFLATPIANLAPPENSLQPGDHIANRYRIERLIGHGGMGEVYEALDEAVQERIALKTLRPRYADDEEVQLRFQREIQLARKVTHPNVCRVYDVGAHGTLPFFTMQLLAGETLAERIKRQGRLTAAEAFPFIEQIADGLHAAHSAGVIHRDIKSANIIVTAQGQAIITDFGLARFKPTDSGPDGQTTIASNARIAGTVGYMSPEQLRGAEITAASDIYSFGIVLFEMASGKLPFDERHIINSAIQRASGQIPWIRSEVPGIDARWEQAIVRCLQPEPAQRFATAADLADHFRGKRWSIPRPQATRRWSIALAAAALAAIGGYIAATRPYQPLPEAQQWYEKGLEHSRATMFDAARRAFEKSIAIDPNHALAHAYLSMALSELDYSERAKESALRAVTAAQEHRVDSKGRRRLRAVQHYAAREFKPAQQEFAALAADASGVDRPPALLEAAMSARRAEDLPAALAATSEAVKLDPNYAAAWLLRGQLLAQKRDNDQAFAALDKAQALFNAASNHEAVTETLLQRAIHETSTTKYEQAIATIDRALKLAAATSDTVHETRLKLALALAFRNLDQIDKSKQIAEEAVAVAERSGQDLWAATGLIDLGVAYFLRGEPAQAEAYFKRGVSYASRQKWRWHESRGRIMLASLCMQYGRATEAVDYASQSLPFFREAHYRREILQGLIILGNAQAQLGNLKDAEKHLREALAGFDSDKDEFMIPNAENALAEILTRRSQWTEARVHQQKALTLRIKTQPNSPPVHQLLLGARLDGYLGHNAESAFAEVERRLAERPGAQLQVRAAIATARGEYFYTRGRFGEAVRHSRLVKTGEEDLLISRIVEALATSRFDEAERAIDDASAKKLRYIANSGKLWLAETKPRDAARLAKEALTYFEEQDIGESIWRCHLLLGGDAKRAREAWEATLSAPDRQSYAKRLDVEKLKF